MVLKLDDKLREELIEFARNYDYIKGISKGNDPEAVTEEEARRPVYYFLGPGQHNENFEDALTDLDIRLCRQGEECELARWPCDLSSVENEYFLGEIIWRRDS